MSKDKYKSGLQTRTEVLGAEHVNQSIANATKFSEPLQNWIIECGWGHIWTREGLPKKTRSLITLAMLTALNRPHELKTHLKGAIRNGCTEEEISEVLLQAAVYCGAPAAIDSFEVAQKVLNDKELNLDA